MCGEGLKHSWRRVKGKGCFPNRAFRGLRSRAFQAGYRGSKEEIKSLSMKLKEDSEKVDLKLNIQKTKIMASWSHHFMAYRCGNNGNSERLFFGLQNH